ncbi:hypothetical protein [Roseinatronobacter bogoriensis]|nr:MULTISPECIES: hypothetical protein [Rhodobaca]
MSPCAHLIQDQVLHSGNSLSISPQDVAVNQPTVTPEMVDITTTIQVLG